MVYPVIIDVSIMNCLKGIFSIERDLESSIKTVKNPSEEPTFQVHDRQFIHPQSSIL